MSIKSEVLGKVKEAKVASRILANISTAKKNKALRSVAGSLIKNKSWIKRENKKDLEAAKKARLSNTMIDRLVLNDKRIKDMADGLREVVNLPDPVGEDIKKWRRPNGLCISKVRVPFGVIGIIYESRPNVTIDSAGLCLKSGSSVILKGGSEAINSNLSLVKVMKRALKKSDLPEACVQILDRKSREAVKYMLSLDRYIDLIIPRGGEGLIRVVSDNSKIPVIKHYKGVCHVYVDKDADLKMAEKICLNAKVQRPGVCNAMETMLVHKSVAKKFLPGMIERFKEQGVEIRACSLTRRIVKGVKAARTKDWSTEYLDLILSVKVVGSLEEAIEHINKFGSSHSDAIVTKRSKSADRFLKQVDSAVVFVNASTRFTDGYQFGMGAEIGISTDKLHARGPMGLEELTTYKFVVHGNGQLRK